jgi:chemotaxis protein MotB
LSSENIPVQEIVIIRRGGTGDDEGHHGGMWKIAFADFMTAMMAFFLVMWLINATDDKTKTEIATYFNPIKLPDQQKTEKALQTADTSGGENQEAINERTAPKGQTFKGSGKEDDGKQTPKKADDALFADPYGILSKLATQAPRVALPADVGMRKDGKAQLSGGAAFRDPFDPDFRKRSADVQVQTPAAARDDTPDADTSKETPSPLAQDIADGPGDAPVAKKPATGKPGGAQSAENKPDAAESGSQSESTKIAAADPAAQMDAPAPSAKQSPDAAIPQATAAQLDAAIHEALRQANIANLPDINVTRTSEGLLISLTDKMNYEMFGIASAQPRPELVVAMEKIGTLLQSRPEKIVIRGHTDARPFRSATYDNWRLSSDRANVAHFMLARGGLAESRFEKIEGYADKSLNVPNDPKAAGNRRIEILLRQPAS